MLVLLSSVFPQVGDHPGGHSSSFSSPWHRCLASSALVVGQIPAPVPAPLLAPVPDPLGTSLEGSEDGVKAVVFCGLGQRRWNS